MITITETGCSGSACHDKCLLGSFLLISGVVNVLTLTGLLVLFMYHTSERDWLAVEAKKSIMYYDAMQRWRNRRKPQDLKCHEQSLGTGTSPLSVTRGTTCRTTTSAAESTTGETGLWRRALGPLDTRCRHPVASIRLVLRKARSRTNFLGLIVGPFLPLPGGQLRLRAKPRQRPPDGVLGQVRHHYSSCLLDNSVAHHHVVLRITLPVLGPALLLPRRCGQHQPDGPASRRPLPPRPRKVLLMLKEVGQAFSDQEHKVLALSLRKSSDGSIIGAYYCPRLYFCIITYFLRLSSISKTLQIFLSLPDVPLTSMAVDSLLHIIFDQSDAKIEEVFWWIHPFDVCGYEESKACCCVAYSSQTSNFCRTWEVANTGEVKQALC